MDNFYQNLIGIPDAMIERTRGMMWAGMRTPRVDTHANEPVAPDAFERGRQIALDALGKSSVPIKEGEDFKRGQTIAEAALAGQPTIGHGWDRIVADVNARR